MDTSYRFSIVLLLVTSTAFSQTVLDTPLTDVRAQSLASFLDQLEAEYPVKAFYLEDWIIHFSVDNRFNDHTVVQILDTLLEGSEVSYTFLYGYALIFSKDPAAAIERRAILSNASIQRKQIRQKSIGDKTAYIPGMTAHDRVFYTAEISFSKNTTRLFHCHSKTFREELPGSQSLVGIH